MLTHKDFSCWVEIEGEEAKEYDIQQAKDDEGVDTVTCWIASEVGKVFKKTIFSFAFFNTLLS